MARARSSKSSPNFSANIGFEAKLWLAADKLRSNIDAAEYKHVVLGLIFLEYISDSFEEHHAKLIAGKGEYAGANPEDPDEYRAENIFWVPPAARWSYLQNSAKQPTIGKIVDDAMVAIERDNPRLKGILSKDYARPALDKNRLDERRQAIDGRISPSVASYEWTLRESTRAKIKWWYNESLESMATRRIFGTKQSNLDLQEVELLCSE
jgi:type I restriction-modification system DNA methylase subunit